MGARVLRPIMGRQGNDRLEAGADLWTFRRYLSPDRRVVPQTATADSRRDSAYPGRTSIPSRHRRFKSPRVLGALRTGRYPAGRFCTSIHTREPEKAWTQSLTSEVP